MTIKRIDKDECRDCGARTDSSCPVIESCPTDVVRMGEDGLPYAAYPDDCMSCFLCQVDCAGTAVEVSAEIPLPLLPSY